MTKGERIKLKREQRGISQNELALKINVSKQNMYKYENDIITNIPSDKIELIAKVLNVSPAYIMGWESVPDSQKRIESTTIGTRIKKARKDLNLTQEYVANKIGVNAHVIYKYENDVTTIISLDKLEKLSKVLNTTPSFLMGFENTTNPESEIALKEDENNLINTYRKLNDIGKKAATERVEDLLYIPKYISVETPSNLRFVANKPISAPPIVKRKPRHT